MENVITDGKNYLMYDTYGKQNTTTNINSARKYFKGEIIMTNTDNFPCKLNDRIYIVQRKYNKICYGNIVGINLYKRIVTIQLDSGKLFKTNILGLIKVFFLNIAEAENILNGVNNND